MGIIKAASGSIAGMFADQWKEFFYCDSMTSDLLVTHATNHVGSNSSNTKGTSDYISDGSVVVVNQGEAALVSGGGRIQACWTEPGEYVFHSDKTSGVFGEQGVKGMASDAWERFTFGGDTPRASQRVFYVNMKEIMGNYLSMPSPIPFRVIDSVTGLNLDASLQCEAVYSFRLCDPALFLKQIVGYIPNTFAVADIAPQIQSEMRGQLQAAASSISAQTPLRLCEIPTIIPAIQDSLISRMNESLRETRGMELVSFNLISFNLSEGDRGHIVSLQMANVLKDPAMAQAYLEGARADALRLAASNGSGALMGMAAVGAVEGAMSQRKIFIPDWLCPNCGHLQNTRFCEECGTKNPGWYCSEGHYNIATRSYCIECTEKAPADILSAIEQSSKAK